MAQIILSEGETVDSITINGCAYKIYPFDVTELSDGRRVVSVLHAAWRTVRHRAPIDTGKLRIASSTGPSIDAAGIIVGGQ